MNFHFRQAERPLTSCDRDYWHYRSCWGGTVHMGFPRLLPENSNRKRASHPRRSLGCRRFLHRRECWCPGSSCQHGYLKTHTYKGELSPSPRATRFNPHISVRQ